MAIFRDTVSHLIPQGILYCITNLLGSLFNVILLYSQYVW